MYDIPNFLKRENEKLLFDLKDKELVYFIPESYFTSKIAVIEGEYLSTIGVMDYSITDLKTGKYDKLRPFRFPTTFLSKPYTIVKEKGLQLTDYSAKVDYRLAKFKQGDEVVVSVKVPQLVDNAEEFFKILFITAKIPTTLPYDILWEYFIENFSLNGGSYNANYQLIMMMLSEICRDIKDPSKPFRLSNDTNMYHYELNSIKQLVRYTSPLASLASENWDESVMSAVMMSKDEKNIKNTPLERVVM